MRILTLTSGPIPVNSVTRPIVQELVDVGLRLELAEEHFEVDDPLRRGEPTIVEVAEFASTKIEAQGRLLVEANKYISSREPRRGGILLAEVDAIFSELRPFRRPGETSLATLVRILYAAKDPR